ncbi:MAG: hypothetical protein WC863_00850 [Patescibacteria group bacterium]
METLTSPYSLALAILLLSILSLVCYKLLQYKQAYFRNKAWKILFLYSRRESLNFEVIQATLDLLVEAIQKGRTTNVEILELQEIFFSESDKGLSRRIKKIMNIENETLPSIPDLISECEYANYFQSEEFKNSENLFSLIKEYNDLCTLVGVCGFDSRLDSKFESELKENILAILGNIEKNFDLFGWKRSGCYYRYTQFTDTVKKLSYVNPESCAGYLELLKEMKNKNEHLDF